MLYQSKAIEKHICFIGEGGFQLLLPGYYIASMIAWHNSSIVLYTNALNTSDYVSVEKHTLFIVYVGIYCDREVLKLNRLK